MIGWAVRRGHRGGGGQLLWIMLAGYGLDHPLVLLATRDAVSAQATG
jgi:hypothetical protein